MSMPSTFIEVTTNKLNFNTCYNFVTDASCGGIASFIGTVRNTTNAKRVTKLEFTTYKPMAIKELQKIANTALKTYAIYKIAIQHAEGILNIGDVPVIITVSAPHRQEALQACAFIIDTLKETVPIWKKEVFSDGSVWVNAHSLKHRCEFYKVKYER
jgi:Molybdopterin converting factor, large subunit